MSTAQEGKHGSSQDLSTLDMSKYYYLPTGELVHYTHEEVRKANKHKDFEHVRSGTCVLFFNSEMKVLVGPRKGSHGAGQLATPGGHLDPHEDLYQCAMRETEEETGLKIKNPRYIHGYHDNFIVSMRKEDKDKKNDNFADVDSNRADVAKKAEAAGDYKIRRMYISNWLVAEQEDPTAEPQLMEPEKCEGWVYKTIEELRTMAEERPQDVFLPLRNFLANNPNFCTADLLTAGTPKDHKDRFGPRPT